jgi:hypothetical protein
VLQSMTNTRIRSQRANVRVAAPRDIAHEDDAPRVLSRPPKFKARDDKKGKKNDRKGGKKPPKRRNA